MVFSLKPRLKECNFSCKYCYQKPYETKEEYDVEKMIEVMKKEYNGRKIAIHGAEPTALPHKDFKRLLEEAYNLSGSVSIQTNGYLLDKYFDLLKQYNVSIGISYDGPDECNLLRGFGNDEQRLKVAKKVEDNIFKAIDEGLNPTLIVVIHRLNGIEHIDKFKEFLLRLKEKGVTSGRMNPCSVTKDIADKPSYQLTVDELIKVYDDLSDFCMKHGLRYSPLTDIMKSVKGNNDKAVCTFRQCDIYNTSAETCLLGDGTLTNCLKTYHHDVYYPQTDDKKEHIRTQLLFETDCEGCKWFGCCHGGCPNNGIDSDWRRKTKYCKLWKFLFNKFDNILKFVGISSPSKYKNGNISDEERVNRPTSGVPDHSDGIEHKDGHIRHLDSDVVQ